MSDPGAANLYVILGVAVFLAIAAVNTASMWIHRRREREFIADLKENHREVYNELLKKTPPGGLASRTALLLASYGGGRKSLFVKAYEDGMYHTAVGRAFLQGIDELRESIKGALVLALGFSLGNAINYEAQLLGVPSQGYFGSVLVMLILVTAFSLFTSGLKHCAKSHLQNGGIYDFPDEFTEGVQQKLQAST